MSPSPAIEALPQVQFNSLSLSKQIKEKKQDFMINYHEFESLQNPECLIKEFENLIAIKELILKIEMIFLKFSKILKVNKNNQLDLMDYIVIYQTVEKKINNKKFSMILTVIYFNYFKYFVFL